MQAIWEFTLRHGYGLLFAVVLAEQLGAPVPAAPVLLAAGALAGLGHLDLGAALALATFAAVAGDLAWFELGRRRGDSILGLLCRISLEPDSCVRRTRNFFGRWGAGALVVAKFVPGLSTAAPPLAATNGMPVWRFLALDVVGAALWSGAGLVSGYFFHNEVERVAEALAALGSGLVVALAAPLALYLSWKLFQRRRVLGRLRVARITPVELLRRFEEGPAPVVFDLRSPAEVLRSGGRVSGALLVPADEVEAHCAELSRDTELVFYCS
jgi:membrane protein DedA with SNARE-associated domain